MKKLHNTLIQKTVKLLVLLLVGLCFTITFPPLLSSAQTLNNEENSENNPYLIRAQELFYKTERTPQEEKELSSLINIASKISEDKQSAATKNLIKNYNSLPYQKSLADAQKKLDEYNSGNYQDNYHKATNVNTAAELSKEVQVQKILLERSQEDLSSKTGDLGRLLQKEQELLNLDNEYADVLASKRITTSGGLNALSQSMNNSTDHRYNERKKEYENKKNNLSQDIDNLKSNLTPKESTVYEKRKKENELLASYRDKQIYSNKMQEKYCGGKQPPECDWKNKATTSEINSYRNITSLEITTSIPNNSCAPKKYLAEYKGQCLLCGLFKVAFNTASKIAKLAMNALSQSVILVVVVGAALWLAITVLSFLSSIETKDTKDLASTVINQFFIVIIVLVLLQTGGEAFFKLALEPIFNTGMALAQKAMSGEAGCIAGSYGILTESQGGGLPSSMGDNILCTMTLVQDKVAEVKAVGMSAMCYSMEKNNRTLFIIPHLGYLLTGLGLWFGAMIMIIAVPFLMIDSVIQMTVASALVPAAIGAYAFKITRGYVKKVWETFLNAMFNFVFLSIITLILTTMFVQVLSADANLETLANSGEESMLMAEMLIKIGWGGESFLKICFVLILTWTVLGEISAFAKQFAGSISSTKIGSSIGAMAASGAKSATKATLGKTAEASWDVTKSGAKFTGRGIAHVARRGYMNIQASRYQRKAEAAAQTAAFGKGKTGSVERSADGSTKYTYSSNRKIMGIKLKSTKTTEVNVAADGTKRISQVKTHKDGSRDITEKDAYFTVKRTERPVREKKSLAQRLTMRKGTVQRNVRGEVIYETVDERITVNDSVLNNTIRDNGTVDLASINEVMKNSTHNKDLIASVIAKRLIKARMPNATASKNYSVQNVKYELDNEGNFASIQMEQVDAAGNRSEISIEVGNNERVMTTLSTFDKNGKGKTLSSDGIINSKKTFRHQNGVVDEENSRTTYSLNSHYASFNREKNRYSAFGETMFSDEERDMAYRQTRVQNPGHYSNNYEFK